MSRNGSTPSLKSVCKFILDKDIQIGEHDSVEDAQAVMSIYHCLSADWEQYIKDINREIFDEMSK